MKTATFIEGVTRHNGEQRLYRLSEPIESYDHVKYDHVIVSAVDVLHSGPETYIFGARDGGKECVIGTFGIANWTELDGSYRGGIDCEEALRRAGDTSRMRRDRNRAARLCVNENKRGTHGPATHGTRCFRCSEVHKHGVLVVERNKAAGLSRAA